MKETPRLRVVMFSGGRGTGSITEALLRLDQVDLTLLVNAYDDGLSTGALRSFIPGMLGPSDVRKNVARLMNVSERCNKALQNILEYRFPKPIDPPMARAALISMADIKSPTEMEALHAAYEDINMRQALAISDLIKIFLAYADRQPVPFDFSDCSLGNILFAGMYLKCGENFNVAMGAFAALCETNGRVLNVSDGENLVLAAVKENGALLSTEAEIVAQQDDDTPIQRLFLLPEMPNRESLKGFTREAVMDQLNKLSRNPKLNPEAKTALEQADIIIYGPGTQHSSLFPSYLTEGVTDAILSNHTAEKIFIGNIHKDNEIRRETAASLATKFLWYMNGAGRTNHSPQDLVTLFFMQKPSSINGEKNYVSFDSAAFPFPPEKVVLTDWESSGGTHSGPHVVQELIHIVNSRLRRKIKSLRTKLSIVVPALNEERTVKKVLTELIDLDIDRLGMDKEIIFVDGGSTDKTMELAKSIPGVRIFSVNGAKGRGAAFRMGIDNATGDTVAFFPSDGEYTADDLLNVVQPVSRNDYEAVFGSRAIKCGNVNQRILDIYQGNYFLYLLSKYGGMLLSIIGLLLYNRFVSDPLTGVKAFDTRLVRELRLKSNSLDLETELMARLSQSGVFILEVPVGYRARKRGEGKKTTAWDGLEALWRLISCRFKRS